MFYGITPKTNLLNCGIANSPSITKLASTPINQPYITPTPSISFNTDIVVQHQAAFIFSDFLWKYRWEIGIGIGVLVIGGLYIYNTNKKSEEENRNR
jgi:hypothetical protein